MLACTIAASAADTTWNADPVHSSATFTITHLGISHVSGTIAIKSASVVVPEGSNIPTSATAALDPSTVDTHNDMRNGDLKSPHFFDVATYPTMTFASTKITAIDATHFTMVGDLTMHGQTHSATLTGEYIGRMTDSRGHQHIGYASKGTIDRTQWGMTYGPVVVGNTADLEIDVEVISK
jgi:polyisoprenoid-binding protein YceI